MLRRSGAHAALFVALAFVVLPSVSMPPRVVKEESGSFTHGGSTVDFQQHKNFTVHYTVDRSSDRGFFKLKVDQGDAEAQIRRRLDSFISLRAKGVFEAAPQAGPPPPRSPGEEPHSSSPARVDSTRASGWQRRSGSRGLIAARTRTSCCRVISCLTSTTALGSTRPLSRTRDAVVVVHTSSPTRSITALSEPRDLHARL